MVSTFTTRLRLDKQGTGDNSGTWGTTLNRQLDLLDEGVAGLATVAHDDSASGVVLTTNSGTSDQARNMILVVDGTLSASRDFFTATISKFYVVRNTTSGGFDIWIKTLDASSTGVNIPASGQKIVFTDGTDFFEVPSDVDDLVLQSPEIVSGTMSGGVLSSVTMSGGVATGVEFSGGTVSGATIEGGTVTGLSAPLGLGDGGTAATGTSSGGILHSVGFVYPRGYIDGFQMTRNTASEDHLDISDGMAVDSTSSQFLDATSTTVSKGLDSAWASGDDAGGLASALTVAANTWYAVLALLHTDGSVDFGFDTNGSTATNLLQVASGWTRFRRVGWIKTSSGTATAIQNFKQHSNEFMWASATVAGFDQEQLSVSGTDMATIGLFNTPPDVVRTKTQVAVRGGSANPVMILVADFDYTGTLGPSVSGTPLRPLWTLGEDVDVAGTHFTGGIAWIWTGTGQYCQAAVNSGIGTATTDWKVAGWEDLRGRDG